MNLIFFESEFNIPQRVRRGTEVVTCVTTYYAYACVSVGSELQLAVVV
jgi:hypothetical protein